MNLVGQNNLDSCKVEQTQPKKQKKTTYNPSVYQKYKERILNYNKKYRQTEKGKAYVQRTNRRLYLARLPLKQIDESINHHLKHIKELITELERRSK